MKASERQRDKPKTITKSKTPQQEPAADNTTTDPSALADGPRASSQGGRQPRAPTKPKTITQTVATTRAGKTRKTPRMSQTTSGGSREPTDTKAPAAGSSAENGQISHTERCARQQNEEHAPNKQRAPGRQRLQRKAAASSRSNRQRAGRGRERRQSKRRQRQRQRQRQRRIDA